MSFYKYFRAVTKTFDIKFLFHDYTCIFKDNYRNTFNKKKRRK